VKVKFANVRFVVTPVFAVPPVKTTDIPFQLNVCHVINDAPDALHVTVAVLAETVRLVTFTFQGLVVEQVIEEEPSVSVLVFVLFELKPPHKTVLPLVSKVPAVWVRVAVPVEPTVKSSCN
jgi:hypothetical protein